MRLVNKQKAAELFNGYISKEMFSHAMVLVFSDIDGKYFTSSQRNKLSKAIRSGVVVEVCNNMETLLNNFDKVTIEIEKVEKSKKPNYKKVYVESRKAAKEIMRRVNGWFYTDSVTNRTIQDEYINIANFKDHIVAISSVGSSLESNPINKDYANLGNGVIPDYIADKLVNELEEFLSMLTPDLGSINEAIQRIHNLGFEIKIDFVKYWKNYMFPIITNSDAIEYLVTHGSDSIIALYYNCFKNPETIDEFIDILKKSFSNLINNKPQTYPFNNMRYRLNTDTLKNQMLSILFNRIVFNKKLVNINDIDKMLGYIPSEINKELVVAHFIDILDGKLRRIKYCSNTDPDEIEMKDILYIIENKFGILRSDKIFPETLLITQAALRINDEKDNFDAYTIKEFTEAFPELVK
jgi:hypothetical protein